MTPRAQMGFGLVELMIALTIGLLIMAAVSSILVTSKAMYTTQDSLARLQENARFALQVMLRDIRMAGYYGCADDVGTVSNRLNGGGGSANWLDFGNAVEGSEAQSVLYPSGTALGVVAQVAGSDAFALRYLDPSNAVAIVQEMPQQSASMKVNSGSELAAGDIVMISDCNNADLFQITNLNAAGGFDNVIHNTGGGWPGNDSTLNPHKLSKSYGTDAQVMKFVSVRYYVATKANGERALFRQALAATGGAAAPIEQELAEGVEDMRVLYGIDTDGDRAPDRYLKAGVADLDTADEWANVVSLRVGLLLSSLANKDTTPDKSSGTQKDTATYSVNGEVVDPPDLARDRRVFVTTAVVRNRQ